ncbi:hypothetical protein EROM_061210 [Encephalitozoon romaleae SJ-2008]|uniref:Uncharacterized protein n=1 Tax=Encephalitozoon romaleae (strain SJ-2008) TaxID=1178016 RepID=I6ZJ25_ENCRO|nr:hypothetical protein EROM_061210 [Encephalitozoon romaleae SJ-2008]AFN83213.1 hypothetical protein EROM_061210 [Encephalitozoon romaleae SJ-2008]
MIFCETCGSPLEIIGNDYVCSEGHITKNTIEFSNEERPILLDSSTNDTKLKKLLFKKYGPDYMELLGFYILFNDIREHLCIKSLKYFNIFANSIKEGPKKTLPRFLLVSPTLRALTYYSKRIEMEAEGKTYLYMDYYKSMMTYPYEERRRIKLTHLGITNLNIPPVRFEGTGLIPVYRILRFLGERNVRLQKNRSHGRLVIFYGETGVLDEKAENNKACFREDLRRDYEMFFKYLQRICDIFVLEITEDLEEKFKAFFYMLDLTKTIHIPEVEISVFLYIYIMNYKKDFDVLRAIRNLNEILREPYSTLPEEIKYIKPEDLYGKEERLQSYLKTLISKATWFNSTEIEEKLGNFKRLFSSSRTQRLFNDYWGRIHDRHKPLFIRNAWYVKKLIILKRMKTMKESEEDHI